MMYKLFLGLSVAIFLLILVHTFFLFTENVTFILSYITNEIEDYFATRKQEFLNIVSDPIIQSATLQYELKGSLSYVDSKVIFYKNQYPLLEKLIIFNLNGEQIYSYGEVKGGSITLLPEIKIMDLYYDEILRKYLIAICGGIEDTTGKLLGFAIVNFIADGFVTTINKFLKNKILLIFMNNELKYTFPPQNANFSVKSLRIRQDIAFDSITVGLVDKKPLANIILLVFSFLVSVILFIKVLI